MTFNKITNSLLVRVNCKTFCCLNMYLQSIYSELLEVQLQSQSLWFVVYTTRYSNSVSVFTNHWQHHHHHHHHRFLSDFHR